MNYELESIYNDENMKKYVEKLSNMDKIEKENEDLKKENEDLKKENERLKNKNHELNRFIETIMSNFNLHIKNESTFNSIKQGVQNV